MNAVNWLLTADGAAFTAIGVVVLATPSPQPTLTTPVAPAALVPFKDTRRLLASQFLGAGLLAVLVGTQVHDTSVLRWAVAARVVTLLTVVAVNVSQLRNRAWKRPPLLLLVSVFTALVAGYLTLVASS